MQQVSELNNWVESLVTRQKALIQQPWKIEPLQGDAGCRQYFRLLSKKSSWILVVSPLQRIDNNIFIELAKDWLAQGVRVPEVFYIEEKKGYMLLEDFGSKHLFDCFKQSAKLNLYRQAIEQLHKIQQISPQKLMDFNRDFLLREMNIFATWMLQFELQLSRPAFLDQVFELLVENAREQPQITMHRDYHSRNLLVKHDQIAVIDFQDAVHGPLAYDLVSLLKDCYLSLSESEIDTLVDEYLSALNSSGLLGEKVEKNNFMRWFDLMGLQRHLKVLGLFIRLAEQEGKKSYLNEIARVFCYVLQVTGSYGELAEFDQWLRGTLQPALQRKAWYIR